MSRYPGAVWRPVGWANARDDSTPATIVVLHLTASEADSQWGYFNSSRKACSTFHVARDGRIEQYIDTDRISASEGAGSNDAIGIETEGADVDGEWTPAQVRALVKLLAWINRVHGIPLRLKTNSSPSERGIGWHRLGVSGNFPLSPPILRGRNQRGYAGESWSSSFGKVCPGNRRILQIEAIVEAARSGDSVKPIPVDNWKGAMGWSKLRLGDTGNEVKAFQEKLLALGYSVGPDGADGRFGGDTELGAKDFQNDHGLMPDAVIGKDTQNALKRAKPPAQETPAPPPPAKPKPATPAKKRVHRTPPTLRRGSKNAYAGLWQNVLEANGYDVGKVDSDFGTRTERATKAWQADRDLKPDGVVGKNSWSRALLAGGTGRLRKGDRGPHVGVLQVIVGVRVDWSFGPDTENATQEVQRWYGVKPDGVVGPDFVHHYRSRA